MDTSPAQSLLGRHCKTLLPSSGTLLMPKFSLDNDAAKLCARKKRQRRYFNRGKRVLCPVKAGEAIRARSPTGIWKPAECPREVAPGSYEVLVDGAVRRRNRKDIWRTAESPNTCTSEEVEPFQRAPNASPDPDPETPLFGPASSPVEADCVGDCVGEGMSNSLISSKSRQKERESMNCR